MNVYPAQILVLAKQPVPGRVKTRLCPPCTPAQAADIAAAALADTLDVVAATAIPHRVLVIEGQWPAPAGWQTVPQRGTGLGERLANAFTDTARDDTATLLIGMDTPQVTAGLLNDAMDALADADAAFGPALDGGWWALALREPHYATLLRGIPTSTPQTGALTLLALRSRSLRVRQLAALRDVDTATDAHLVAAEAPAGRFAAMVRRHLPLPPVLR